jgi:hypothetical protein
MSFKLGSVRATPAVASAAGRVPGVVAVPQKMKQNDYTTVLTDESIADMMCLPKKSDPKFQMESLVDIVSRTKVDNRTDEKVPYMTVWSPYLVATWSMLHAVGCQKSKYPEANVADRTYIFKCSTAIPDGMVAKINGDKHEKNPGFDIKREHRFYNGQNAKVMVQTVQQLWDMPEFAKSWRDYRIDELSKIKIQSMIDDLEKQKTEGKISAKECKERTMPLKAKTFKFASMTPEDQQSILDQLYGEFKRALAFPMHKDENAPVNENEDDDAPQEYEYEFKIKIFQKPQKLVNPLSKVPPSDVEKEVAKRIKEEEEKCAAAGKTFVQDDYSLKRLTAVATKDLCVAAGYLYNQVEFMDFTGKPPYKKAKNFLDPMCYSGFIVRVGYNMSAYATKGKDAKLGIRFMGKPRIQILYPVKPTRIDDGPGESDFGIEFSFESISELVGRIKKEEELPAPLPAIQAPVPRASSSSSNGQKRKAVAQPTVVTVQPAAKRQKTGVSAAQGRVRKAAPAPEPEPEPIDEDEYSDHELQAMEQDGAVDYGSEGEYTDEE